tara:strand:+ start:562 stop:2046 length:1485 start_codon:yes stop_codon:yes gene_type:complete
MRRHPGQERVATWKAGKAAPARLPARAALWAAVLAGLLSACGTPPPATSVGPGLLDEAPPAAGPQQQPTERAPLLTGQALRDAADFYWPYAALAAEVYAVDGRPDSYTALAFDSPSLRQEVRGSGHVRAQTFVRQLDDMDTVSAYEKRYELLCGLRARQEAAASGDTGRAELLARHCATLDARQDAQLARQLALEERGDAQPNQYVDARPADDEDCRYTRREPSVPVNEALREYQWSRLPEFQAEAQARGWSLFVPDLAIDVWRRPRAPVDGVPVFEYAIVYRGTVGGGGWVSNLRGVTSFTPFVWDQYRQAERASRMIIGRIQRLHALSDLLHERRAATQPYITTVGHSLGAGLAVYIQLLNPEVTRSVGFNPSPVDGTSMIQVGDAPRARKPSRAVINQQIAQGLRRVDPGDAGQRGQAPAQAAIFQMHEEGEVLSRFSGCTPGPLWGAEGGPGVHCDVVNLSRGSWIRQHNMAQMACKLALVHEGKPIRPD